MRVRVVLDLECMEVTAVKAYFEGGQLYIEDFMRVGCLIYVLIAIVIFFALVLTVIDFEHASMIPL